MTDPLWILSCISGASTIRILSWDPMRSDLSQDLRMLCVNVTSLDLFGYGLLKMGSNMFLKSPPSLKSSNLMMVHSDSPLANFYTPWNNQSFVVSRVTSLSTPICKSQTVIFSWRVLDVPITFHVGGSLQRLATKPQLIYDIVFIGPIISHSSINIVGLSYPAYCIVPSRKSRRIAGEFWYSNDSVVVPFMIQH